MNRNRKFAAAAVAVCLCLILGVMLTACTPDEPVQLTVPSVTVSDSGLASWTAVENASGYKYKIDNGAETATTATSVQLTDGQSISVKATGDGEKFTDSAYSAAKTYTVPVIHGLPMPETGRYIKDADVIQESDTVRYIVYTTNVTKGEEDNAIAVRKATHDGTGWVYGAESIALEGAASGWDMYLGSASITKGVFSDGAKTYNWLMAYQATNDSAERAYSIGLAVAEEPTGEWTKVGTAPVIAYDKTIYGNFAGCYAPSVVNYDKTSGIRIFFTYADAYGHFAKFWDADLSDLTSIDGSEPAQITNKGNLASGDVEIMFPNADFVYDEANAKFIAIKDYSPSAALRPAYATRIELCEIAEEELYTTDDGQGWKSLGLWDDMDLEIEYFRIYSASVVSDAYGHMLSGGYEIVYNVCETEADNADYLFTQKLLSFVHTEA